jgi:hypothetical protein
MLLQHAGLLLLKMLIDNIGNTRVCCCAVPGGATEARLAVLFAGGAFGVWELDSRLDLRQVRCTPAAAPADCLQVTLIHSQAARRAPQAETQHCNGLCKVLQFCFCQGMAAIAS